LCLQPDPGERLDAEVDRRRGLNALQLAGGFILAVVVAAGAYAAGSLSRGGAIAAIGVGTLTFGVGGVLPGVLLLLFFISSSLLSRVGGARKRQVAAAFAKGGRRDAGQVMANGVLAALLSVGFGLTGDPLWLVGLTGALAAVNADTWATELGVLARQAPRMVTTGLRVDPGTSGAVTVVGTAAALGGALFISLPAAAAGRAPMLALIASVSGLAGSSFDSLLGATVQAIYTCPACAKETERHPFHSCGTPTVPLRGWRWLDNDGVNFAASLVGAVVSVGAWILIGVGG
jgi:uncharacterized protein (TIGR00297 family)